MGEAKGESLCVGDSNLGQFVYCKLPNVAEWALLSLILAPFWQLQALLGSALVAALAQIFLWSR